MSPHEIYMLRCLELAQNGLGHVAPNPMVGCVIVYEGKIIGEGCHQFFGGPHAEVNAISSIADPSLLKKSTLYVNLEPCSHWGKTPPCADLIVEMGIPKVVVGCKDIFKEVDGRGIKKLRDAGINVEVGVLEGECTDLNRRFINFNIRKKPYIILKWAQTADGFIAREDYSSKWISNACSRLMVHQWRAQEAAVMVGTNTAWYDDPQLSARDMKAKNPIRIVFDKNGKLPKTLHVFDGRQPTLVFVSKRQEPNKNFDYITLDFDDKNFLAQALGHLHGLGIQSVMVEGGTKLLQSFIDQGLWDEARVFESPNIYFDKGIAAPTLRQRPVNRFEAGNDVVSYFRYP